MSNRRELDPDSKPRPADASRFPLDKRLPANRLAPAKTFASADGLAVETAKLNEIAGLLWLPARLSAAERDAQLVKALDLLESIKPGDGIEMMLAEQMVGTHAAALDCLRRAMLENQTFEGRNAALGHAQKLMALYTNQVAALDKYRGKGQQKVTVEHVHVAPGGQAFVGNVARSAQRERRAPEDALDGNPRPLSHAREDLEVSPEAVTLPLTDTFEP